MVEKNKTITKSNHIYLAYMAGLFDGEGCVTYKQYWSSKRDNRPNKYFSFDAAWARCRGDPQEENKPFGSPQGAMILH